MKESFKSIVVFILFWLLFFALCRTAFILTLIPKWEVEGLSSMFRSFLFALPMDLSTAAYFGAIPLLIWAGLFVFKKVPLTSQPFRFYVYTLICIVSVLTVVDVYIYREWGTKINYRAFEILFKSPNEAFASAASSPIFVALMIIFLLIISGILLYKKIKPQYNSIGYPHLFVRIGFVALVFALLFISLRGGVSNSPLTVSSVYYSKNQALNYATINTEWNLFRDALDNMESKTNPFIYMKDEEAKQICDSLLIVPDSTKKILTVKRPNIVLIILESFTADIIAPLGGEKDVTPFLDSLIEEGLLFSRIHATGYRSDIGFISIHSGYPSPAIRSILSVPLKALHLPSISTTLYQNGYTTSFYYGGETEFFNFRSFILNKNYQRLTDVRDFEKKDQNSKWGVHDGVALNRMLRDLKNEQQPFFSTIMTLSNHEPFEIPIQSRFPGDDLSNKFRSAAFYTDQCLKEFFSMASKESWYNNTLFVLVADHGHRLPKDQYEIFMPQRSHIPLLMFGNVLQQEYRGTKNDFLGSQSDIPATLLGQLDIKHEEFYWSKNLLNPFSKEFAFFSFDNGFTWIEKDRHSGFDNNSRSVIYKSDPKKSDSLQIHYGKAYLQKVYQQFLDY